MQVNKDWAFPTCILGDENCSLDWVAIDSFVNQVFGCKILKLRCRHGVRFGMYWNM